MKDVQVISDGPLFERLMASWRLDSGSGYISAQVLFLASPMRGSRWVGSPGVWYFPVLVGWFSGSPEERAAYMAPLLLQAVLRFLEELDRGEPSFLSVPDLDELWTGKPLRDAPAGPGRVL